MYHPRLRGNHYDMPKVKDGENTLALPLMKELLIYGHYHSNIVLLEGIMYQYGVKMTLSHRKMGGRSDEDWCDSGWFTNR